MKKYVFLSISTFILIIVSGLLFYQLAELQNRNMELQNQIKTLEDQIIRVTNRVSITEFKVYGLSPIGGMTHISTANLTLYNFGINDVEWITLSIISNNVEVLSKPVQIEFFILERN